VCDDHAVMRAGLCRILDDDPGLEVVGEGSTADEAVALAESERPDVFVMDLSLIGEGGISATQRIRSVSPETRVVILTMHEDIAYLREAFAAGATGYVLKKGAYQELALAVRTVAAGQHYVHPSLGLSLMAEDPAAAERKPVPLLSAREAEILRLLVLGYTNAEIGRNVSLSGRTVETYRARIQQKLGLRSRAELVRYARDIGLLD
jgi:DNA-binding NarL/FixJ family response regulator